MKVFISSVRRGLEQERDAMPGLILALGHVPLRFEDFTAQPNPSREVCLRGVAESDVYVLLLGPHYGTVFPETDMSPTHEEHAAALTGGLPRLIFRKDGVDFDDRGNFCARSKSTAPGSFEAASSTRSTSNQKSQLLSETCQLAL